MYNVLIVDDEPIAVESIAYMIKKNISLINRIETSRSGKEAIEKAFKFHPDIIIMDINMPGINGLEAMRQIREGNPMVSFIVVSAFDYFDYAVESVTLGVEEYLLKPVKEVKFVETMQKVLKRIEQDNINRRNNLEQQERLKMMQPILETGFMNALCMYGEDTKELQNYCELIGYRNTGGYVMAIEFGKKSGVMNKIGAGLEGERLYDEYKSIIKSSYNCIVSPIMLNRIIIYIFEDCTQENYEQKSESVRSAQKFIERAGRMNPDIYIGIGRYHKDIQNAKKSYQEALHALRMLLMEEDENLTLHSHILHEDDITENAEGAESDYEQIMEDEIFLRITEQDEAAIQLSFERIYNSMCADQNVNFASIKKCLIGLVVRFGNRFEREFDDDYYHVLSEILNAGNEVILFHVGKRYISETVYQIKSSRQRKANSIVEKADQYILEHYSEEISLEDVAKEVNLSSYYFSRFYKEVSGINFSDKLVQVRIEKAKELLKNEGLSIKDVTFMVGYMEPNYFSKIFKRATGLTATEYKKMYGL